jgi:hypothetical protein
MGSAANQAMKASACPNTVGGASGSADPVPGNSVPKEQEEPAKREAEEGDDVVLLEGDLPPDHYLTHRPKMAKCEACHETKMYHRQVKGQQAFSGI